MSRVTVTSSTPAVLGALGRQTYPHLEIVSPQELLCGDALLCLPEGQVPEPQAVEKLVERLEFNRGVALTYAPPPGHKARWEIPTFEHGHQTVHCYLRGRRPLVGSTLLMRTEFLRNQGGLPTHYRVAGQRAAALKLALHGWVGALDQPLARLEHAPELPPIETLLHEELLMLAEVMAEVGRWRLLHSQMEGMVTRGRERVSDLLLDRLGQGFAQHRSRKTLIQQLKQYSRYWRPRHYVAMARLLAS